MSICLVRCSSSLAPLLLSLSRKKQNKKNTTFVGKEYYALARVTLRPSTNQRT
jgi:hypothetical protein